MKPRQRRRANAKRRNRAKRKKLEPEIREAARMFEAAVACFKETTEVLNRVEVGALALNARLGGA